MSSLWNYIKLQIRGSAVMESKHIILILIATIIIFGGLIAYALLEDTSNPEPQMKTVETKAFKFNTTPDDNWTFYLDHDDGYSYKNDDVNQSKIRYYSKSFEEMGTYDQLDEIGWKKLNISGVGPNVLLYESHFDNEEASSDSYHNYYSAFLELKHGGYVHVSSMDLNRTVTIVNAINEANN